MPTTLALDLICDVSVLVVEGFEADRALLLMKGLSKVLLPLFLDLLLSLKEGRRELVSWKVLRVVVRLEFTIA